MWYTDPFCMDSMRSFGLEEVELGRWRSPDGLKEIVAYDGGMMITTRIDLDNPHFDIRTMHPGQGTADFLNDSLREHITSINKQIEVIQRMGPADLKKMLKPKGDAN